MRGGLNIPPHSRSDSQSSLLKGMSPILLIKRNLFLLRVSANLKPHTAKRRFECTPDEKRNISYRFAISQVDTNLLEEEAKSKYYLWRE